MNVLTDLDRSALRISLAAMTDVELAHVEKVSRTWQGIGDKARREQRKRKRARDKSEQGWGVL